MIEIIVTKENQLALLVMKTHYKGRNRSSQIFNSSTSVA